MRLNCGLNFKSLSFQSGETPEDLAKQMGYEHIEDVVRSFRQDKVLKSSGIYYPRGIHQTSL